MTGNAIPLNSPLASATRPGSMPAANWSLLNTTQAANKMLRSGDAGGTAGWGSLSINDLPSTVALTDGSRAFTGGITGTSADFSGNVSATSGGDYVRLIGTDGSGNPVLRFLNASQSAVDLAAEYYIDGSALTVKQTGGGLARLKVTGGGSFGAQSAIAADALNQLTLSGATDPNKQFLIGYDTTNNVGKIQAIHQGVAIRDLLLQWAGGSVGIGSPTMTGETLIVAGKTRSNSSLSINGAAAQFSGQDYSLTVHGNANARPLYLSTANTNRFGFIGSNTNEMGMFGLDGSVYVQTWNSLTGQVGISTNDLTSGEKLIVGGDGRFNGNIAATGGIRANSALSADQTGLNPAITVFHGAGSNQWGMDLGSNGTTFRTRVFAPAGGDITLSKRVANTGSQTDFVDMLWADTNVNLIKSAYPISGSAGLAIHGATPIAQQTVTGSRGSNAALASLITKLANLGILIDATT